MTPSFSLTATVLGTPDPQGLARFYQRLLGWPIRDDDPRAGPRSDPRRGAPGCPSSWRPTTCPRSGRRCRGTQQMQLHLDIQVDDLAAAAAVARGRRCRALGESAQDDDEVRSTRRPPVLPLGAHLNRSAVFDAGSLAWRRDRSLLPAGLTARPLPTDDAAAVAALLAAAEQVDDTGEYPDAEDVAEWWQGWGLEPRPRRRRRVRRCRGLLVAYATVMASATFRGGSTSTSRDGCAPTCGGRASAGRCWRGSSTAAPPSTPSGSRRRPRPVRGGAGRHALAGGLVRRAGLEPERWYQEMERPLTDLPEQQPADGRRPRAVRLATRRRGAPGTQRGVHPSTTARQRARPGVVAVAVHRPAQLPAGPVRLAIADGAVVGYALAYVFEADTAGDRDRGRSTSVRSASCRPHAAGGSRRPSSRRCGPRRRSDCQSAGLSVDTDNVTGALRLYEKLGFTTRRTPVSWARELPPVGASLGFGAWSAPISPARSRPGPRRPRPPRGRAAALAHVLRARARRARSARSGSSRAG